MIRWYIAAAYAQHAAAEALAEEMRRRGAEIVSTWHQPPVVPSEPGTKAGKGVPWRGCKVEVRMATDVVFLADRGSPRTAYVEVGYALALAEESYGRGSVHWITREMHASPIAAGDSNVRWWSSVEEFLSRLEEL